MTGRPDPCGASLLTAEASTAEAAVTSGDDCPTCEGYGEINECPLRCDGSHVADLTWRCMDCNGSGIAPNPEDYT